jgi:GNAT superfamily N-acetyltransferase
MREEQIGEFLFSVDKNRLDLTYIHQFLSEKSYWASGIPLQLVKTSIENSIAVGVYKSGRQIGFARVITDYATFGYLADVFVDESFRGKGLSKKLMEFIFTFPELKLLRRMMLATRDAQGLYSRYGFNPLKNTDRWMEIHQSDIYKTN